MAIEAIEDVLFAFGFRARSYSELNLSGDMLGVNERAEGKGDGFKSAKAVKAGEGAGKKEEEEEDERIRNGSLRMKRSECHILRTNGY